MSDYARCEATGKRIFFTDHEAREGLHSARAVGKKYKKKSSRECRYYKCDFCGYYHLTSHESYSEPAQTRLKPGLKFFKLFKKYM